jgi:hypothetical protein
MKPSRQDAKLCPYSGMKKGHHPRLGILIPHPKLRPYSPMNLKRCPLLRQHPHLRLHRGLLQHHLHVPLPFPLPFLLMLFFLLPLLLWCRQPAILVTWGVPRLLQDLIAALTSSPATHRGCAISSRRVFLHDSVSTGSHSSSRALQWHRLEEPMKHPTQLAPTSLKTYYPPAMFVTSPDFHSHSHVHCTGSALSRRRSEEAFCQIPNSQCIYMEEKK